MSFSCRLAITIAAVAAFGSAQALTIDAGTLIGVDATGNRLVEYSTSGAIQETLTLSQNIIPVGVEVVGSTLFVMGVGGDIHTVDLSTGALSATIFSADANEGLGSRGGHLLTLNFGTGLVSEFTTAGGLVGNVSVQTNGTGIDGTAGGFVVANYSDANVRFYDAAGVLLSSFGTGLRPGEISGAAYDDDTDTIWISTGFGRGDIRRYSSTGTLLTAFPSNAAWINGLDFVAGHGVPEPAPFALGGLALAAMAASRRRAA